MSSDQTQRVAQREGEAGPGEPRDEYFVVPLAALQPGTVTPVNLYAKFGSPPVFVLHRTAQAQMDGRARDRLVSRGVRELYVLKRDEDAYLDYVEENVDKIIHDDLLPQEQACQIVYKSSSRVMVDVFENPRSGENLRRAQRMVEATVSAVMRNPRALWQMTSMASHDYYTYTHCVNVATFMVGASKDLLDITERQTLERIGMGGIFHDIGKSLIPTEILNKAGKLSADEFRRIKEHPEMGVELVGEHVPMSAVSRTIIRNHHESFNGSGYPDGLTGEGIARLARLAKVVDVYDALTTNRSYASAREPYQALDLMLNKMADEFEVRLLRAFIKFLGPGHARR